jgi:hypothetical protein
MRATSMHPYLALLRVGFAVPRRVATRAVRSYRTISPLPVPEGHRRYVFCGTFRRLAPPRRYLAPCPAEPGLSSTAQAPSRLSGRLRGVRLPGFPKVTRGNWNRDWQAPWRHRNQGNASLFSAHVMRLKRTSIDPSWRNQNRDHARGASLFAGQTVALSRSQPISADPGALHPSVGRIPAERTLKIELLHIAGFDPCGTHIRRQGK